MWYDFFKVEMLPENGFKSTLRYVKSMNVSEEEAARICRHGYKFPTGFINGLKFQNSFVTLREHDGVEFIDLPSWKVTWAPQSMPDSIFRDTCG